MSETILSIKGINKSFSSVKVLENINVNLKKGEILGLIGENGAGKSTLMNIVGGVHKSDSGTMTLYNEPYKPVSSLHAIEKGISFVHQELNIFTNLSVMENLFINGFPKNKLGAIDYRKARSITKDVLSRLDEQIKSNDLLGDLPMGQRQLVEIGKALEKKSKMIIFDEPTTSLSNKEKEKLFEVINSLANEGVSIIYISHILEDVFQLCNRLYVLRDGQITGEVKKSEINRDEIIKLMIGRNFDSLFSYSERKIGSLALSTKSLCRGNQVKEVDLELREGEIVGLFGLMGAGRSELVRTVYGVDELESGEVTIFGDKITRPEPRDMIKRGVAFITDNRREEGLLMPKTVKDNLALAYLDKIKGKLMYVKVKDENIDTDEVIENIKIKTFNKSYQEARTLSGGNQQKVVIGKWMLTEPKIFIMDEPTKGIDIGAKHEIYSKVNELANNGSAILFISSEMEELIGVCDRIIVMFMGRITGQLERANFSQDSLLKLAFGEENI